jgi:hypothetical protein
MITAIWSRQSFFIVAFDLTVGIWRFSSFSFNSSSQTSARVQTRIVLMAVSDNKNSQIHRVPLLLSQAMKPSYEATISSKQKYFP